MLGHFAGISFFRSYVRLPFSRPSLHFLCLLFLFISSFCAPANTLAMLELAPRTLLSIATFLSCLTLSAHSAPIPFQLIRFNTSESSSSISVSLSGSLFFTSLLPTPTLVASVTASTFAVPSAGTGAVQSPAIISSTSSSVTSSTSAAPAVLANGGDPTQSDIDTIRQRRIAIIVQDAIDPLVGTVSDISDWCA